MSNMSTNSCFQIFFFSFRGSRTPTGKPSDCTCAWCSSLPVLVPGYWWVVADEVEAGFVAPVGVMHWPDTSASVVVQLGDGCSTLPGCSFPERASRNRFCCSSMVAMNAASVKPMLGSSPASSPLCAYRAGCLCECLGLGAGGSLGSACGVTRFDLAFGILQMTIVTKRIHFFCMYFYLYMIMQYNAMIFFGASQSKITTWIRYKREEI